MLEIKAPVQLVAQGLLHLIAISSPQCTDAFFSSASVQPVALT